MNDIAIGYNANAGYFTFDLSISSQTVCTVMWMESQFYCNYIQIFSYI